LTIEDSGPGLMRAFAEYVGQIESESDSDYLLQLRILWRKQNESSNKSDSSEKFMADCCIEIHTNQTLPDPTKFPLLHSLSVCTTAPMDQVLHAWCQIHLFYPEK